MRSRSFTGSLAILSKTNGQTRAALFGQAAAGFGRYIGAAYGDLVIGNCTTEAFPTLLHGDPRYFRRGAGSGWSRLRYPAGHTFWTRRNLATARSGHTAIRTHRDSGGMHSTIRRSPAIRPRLPSRMRITPTIGPRAMPLPSSAFKSTGHSRRYPQ